MDVDFDPADHSDDREELEIMLGEEAEKLKVGAH